MKENKAKQLLEEAIEELRKGSIIASQKILEDLYENFDRYINQKPINYNITLDNLILLTLGMYYYYNEEMIPKQKFYVTSFILYDVLSSKNLKVQNPYFSYKKTKMYFIFSERLENRIITLAYNGFLVVRERYIGLLEKGRMEGLNIIRSLDQNTVGELVKIVKEIKSLKSRKALENYVRQYLANLINII